MAKVVFFVSSMQGGGAERIAALLSNDWARRGHSVILVATFSGRGECSYELDPNVRLVFLADIVRSGSRSAVSQLRRLKALRDLVRGENPDVVLSFLSRVNIAVIFSTIGLNIRIVVSERAYPPLQPLSTVMEWLRTVAYPRCTSVVMQSRKGLQWLHDSIPKAQGVVISNPVSYPLPETLAPEVPLSAIDQESKLVLAAGRLDPGKGFYRLLEAFAETVNHFPNWNLVILGEGEQRSELEAKVRAGDLQSRVHLPGRAGNMADWYARADLFVMSSYYEGFPNALLEAMSYGVPVLSTDCDTGPSEIIEHNVNGLLVPVEDTVEALEDGLMTLMRDSTLRQRLGSAAVQVQDRFALSRISDEWERVLGIDSTDQT